MRFEVVNRLNSAASAIEFPWGDASNGYLDLRESPIDIQRIEPARQNSPLAGMLAATNSPPSIFCTVRAKTWPESDAKASPDEAEQFYSRIDLVFAYPSLNSGSAHGEDAARRIVDLWMKDNDAGNLQARLEILPCRFVAQNVSGAALRIILTAHGNSAEQARMRWGLGIARLQQSLLFVSRAIRQKLAIED
jgi:hypothetical protein